MSIDVYIKEVLVYDVYTVYKYYITLYRSIQIYYRAIIGSYRKVFFPDGDYAINLTPGSKPVDCPFYPLSQPEKEVLLQFIEKYLKSHQKKSLSYIALLQLYYRSIQIYIALIDTIDAIDKSSFYIDVYRYNQYLYRHLQTSIDITSIYIDVYRHDLYLLQLYYSSIIKLYKAIIELYNSIQQGIIKIKNSNKIYNFIFLYLLIKFNILSFFFNKKINYLIKQLKKIIENF